MEGTNRVGGVQRPQLQSDLLITSMLCLSPLFKPVRLVLLMGALFEVTFFIVTPQNTSADTR